MKSINYNPWPIGNVPKEFQRPELDKLKEDGYELSDARDAVTIFEKKTAEFSGCKYGVAVDCCTHGMELAFRYLLHIGELHYGETITLPSHTYVSSALMLYQLGFNVAYEDIEWSGVYRFAPTRVWDGAVRWKKGMYVGNNAIQVVSFQIKKRIPIGRGGMILTNDLDAAKWLKLASYDGRDLNTPYTDPNHIKMAGYHYYMTPEDAARGIILMDRVPDDNPDTGNNTTYPNVKNMLSNINL